MTLNEILASVTQEVDYDAFNGAWSEAQHEAGVTTPAIEGTVHVNYRTDPTCKRCKVDPYVPHYNCMYKGKAVGHSAAHCTANACY